MHIVLNVFALIWAIAAVALFVGAASGLHMLLACILLSFALTFVGLAVIIDVLNKRASDAKKALGLLEG
jgi:hypothetical protein